MKPSYCNKFKTFQSNLLSFRARTIDNKTHKAYIRSSARSALFFKSVCKKMEASSKLGRSLPSICEARRVYQHHKKGSWGNDTGFSSWWRKSDPSPIKNGEQL